MHIFYGRQGCAVSSPLSYGQCLREIMQAHRISINELARKMGYRSATSLVRILKDETSVASIEKFHHQLQLLCDWLLPPTDVARLNNALRCAQLGAEGYRLHTAMEELLFQSAVTPDCYPSLLSYSPALCSLTAHASAPFSSFDQLIQSYEHANWVEVIMINTATREISAAFSRLLRFSQKARTIHHYFALEDTPAAVCSSMAAILPLLSEPAYEGYYCLPAERELYDMVRRQSLIAVRFEMEQGNVRTHLFVPAGEGQLSVCALPGGDLFDFYSAFTEPLAARMRPVKTSTVPEDGAQNLLELTERYLLEESERSFFAFQPDVCILCIPTDILLDALREGTGFGLPMAHPMLRRFVEIHNARYDNIHHKPQATYFVYSRKAMRRFARTGHQCDHFFGMRDFTVDERICILERLLQSCCENPSFHVYFLRDDARMPECEFIGFGGMGVQISSAYTDYNAAYHKESLVMFPAFTQAFEDFFVHTLVPEYCLPSEDSQAFIRELIDELKAAR